MEVLDGGILDGISDRPDGQAERSRDIQPFGGRLAALAPPTRRRAERVSASSVQQPALRIDGLAAVPDLEVEARPPERAGLPDGAQRLPLLDRIVDPDVDLVEMARHGMEPVAMVDDDDPAVAAEPAREAHDSLGDGPHRRSRRGGELDAIAERARAELWIDHPAEARGHPRLDRRPQSAAPRREARDPGLLPPGPG